MLNPINDRLDYGKILTPPGGYVLDAAVGTTYGLDLDALIGASVAIGLSESTDGDLLQNPLYVLQALQEVGDKVAVFCEGGQIKYPNKPTPLYILLEKIVFPVKTKKRILNRYPSFHPKMWLIRYKNNENEYIYRVVVMSRNLTFDHSWDVVFAMDGLKTKYNQFANTPLIDFIDYLYKQIDVEGATDAQSAQRKQVLLKSLMKDLAKVKFITDNKVFTDFEFLPVGIKKDRSSYYDMSTTALGMARRDKSKRFDQLLVISPFLSNKAVEMFNNEESSLTPNAERILISRKETIAKLNPESCNKFKKYVLRDVVINGERELSEDSNVNEENQLESVKIEKEIIKRDIHAKLYMWHRYSEAELYLGSLNDSQNAWENNVEFMVKLVSKNRYLNINNLKNSLFCQNMGDDIINPFEEYYAPEIESDSTKDEINSYLDDRIKEINRLKATATVCENGGRYDIRITFEKLAIPDDIDVTLQPLLVENSEKPIEEVMVFNEVMLSQLSEFYVLTLTKDNQTIQRVIKIQTVGIPESRDLRLIRSIVNNKELFYRYIAYLLGDKLAMGGNDERKAGYDFSAYNGSDTLSGSNIPPVYEKMLIAAYENKDRLNRIRNLVEAIRLKDTSDNMTEETKETIIPEDFIELYDTFAKVVDEE